jgi:hypothetical protein
MNNSSLQEASQPAIKAMMAAVKKNWVGLDYDF